MKDIKNYLQSADQDYQAGLILLAKNHKNKQLVKTLSAHESEKNKAALIYHLTKLVPADDVTDQTPEPATVTIIHPQTGQTFKLELPAADQTPADDVTDQTPADVTDQTPADVTPATPADVTPATPTDVTPATPADLIPATPAAIVVPAEETEKKKAGQKKLGKKVNKVK